MNIEELKSRFPRPFEFAKAFFTKGGPSISRLVILMACVTLCYSTILLSKGADDRSASLTVVVAALSGLCGYAYGRGRTSEERKGDVQDA